MCVSTLVFLDYDCYESIAPSDDVQFVTFSDTLCTAAAEYGFDCRHGLEYVDDPSRLVKDEDYDCMRAWLSNQYTHEGVDVGLMMQNTFIHKFCRQLFRRLRTIREAVEAEDPERIIVHSRGRARYEWYDIGDDRIDPALVRAVGLAADVPVELEGGTWSTRIKDAGFGVAGPRALPATERATEIVLRATNRDIPNAGSEVLVHLANANNLDTIRPVLQSLAERGRSIRVVYQSHGFTSTDSKSRRAVSELLGSVRPFETYQNLDVYRTAAAERRHLQERWQEVSETESFTSRFELDGIPVWEVLKHRFWLYYRIQFPRVVKYLETGIRILEHEQPDVVLTKADGPTPVRTFVNLANTRNIPTVLIQHGIKSPINDYLPPSQHVAVWGETASGFFEEKGLDSDRFHVTGAPHFDGLANYDADIAAVKSALDIPEKDAVVTLASQSFDDEIRRSILEAVITHIAPLEGVTVVLRPHPRGDIGLHQEFADRSEHNVRIAAEADIHDLLGATDLLLAINSTVIFEASLLGTPVLVLSFTDERDHPFYAPANGYPRVTDPSQLRDAVTNALNDDEGELRAQQPSFGRKYAHNTDGGAAQRAASLVEQLADGRPVGNISDI
jgi:hypothetical protein